MKILTKNSFPGVLCLLFLLFFTGCRDKEDELPDLTGDAAINQWIQNVMEEVYFWLEEMGTPIALDSEPEAYFESLLYRPVDRFSAIFPDYQELINNLQGIEKEAGYELSLARESNNNENVLAFITYIKKGSPAEAAGLRRGDVIRKINGQVLNLSNYQTLIGQTDNPHSITYSRYNFETLQYVEQESVNLETVVISENPNFLDTVYTINNQKIGYVVYHFFAPGVEGAPNRYDNEMDQIFGKLKAEGINHLIVDFRYNSGGFVSSAVNLASLIAPNVDSNDIFSKTKYNSNLMRFDQFKDVKTPFKTKNQNLGTLSGNKAYIITSRRTASASELIINGLKPYMEIVLIGEKTVGKNVGSVPLEDEENPANTYGLLPIVSKSFNSEDKSDYGNGFTPNIAANELQQPTLLPFGDINEYLLSLAIFEITGEISGGRRSLVDRNDIGSSLEKHIRFGRLIEDDLKFKSQ